MIEKYPGHRREWLTRCDRQRRRSLVANPPFFPCLAEDPLREVQPFLGFDQLLLQRLETVLE
jgi:hypothetical protein